MDTQEKRTIRAIQHLATTARFKAYHAEDHQVIADLLDKADYVCNLITEESPDFEKIQRVLQGILVAYPECSTTLLSIK